MPLTAWTIGYSTRPLEDFLAVLETDGIEPIVEVRRFSGSGRLPHFAAGPLDTALAVRSKSPQAKRS